MCLPNSINCGGCSEALASVHGFEYEDEVVTLPPTSDKPGDRVDRSGNVVAFPHGDVPTAIAPEQPVSSQDQASLEERMAWKHRAMVSRAYAKILRRGGSLGT